MVSRDPAAEHAGVVVWVASAAFPLVGAFGCIRALPLVAYRRPFIVSSLAAFLASCFPLLHFVAGRAHGFTALLALSGVALILGSIFTGVSLAHEWGTKRAFVSVLPVLVYFGAALVGFRLWEMDSGTGIPSDFFPLKIP